MPDHALSGDFTEDDAPPQPATGIDAPKPARSNVLNADEAAELLRMHPSRVRRLTKIGVIPGRKLGGRFVYSRGVLLRWIADGLPDRAGDGVHAGGRSLRAGSPLESPAIPPRSEMLRGVRPELLQKFRASAERARQRSVTRT